MSSLRISSRKRSKTARAAAAAVASTTINNTRPTPISPTLRPIVPLSSPPSSSLFSSSSAIQIPTTTPNTNNNDIQKPCRPLTAYHLFFQLEREYLIQTTAGGPPDADKTMHDNKTYLQNVPRRYRSIKLLPNWYASPGKRAKRKHRKSHGKIGFLELSQIISKRWATLDSTDGETKRFVNEIAQRESNVYKREMEEYKVLLSKVIIGTDDAQETPVVDVVESKKKRGSSSSNQKQQKKKKQKKTKQHAPSSSLLLPSSSSSEQSKRRIEEQTGTTKKISTTTTAPVAASSVVVGAMMISPSTSPSPPTMLNEASLPPTLQYFTSNNNDSTQMQYCQQVSYNEHQVHDFFLSTAIEAADSIAVSPQGILMHQHQHHHRQAEEQQQEAEEEEEDKIDYSICQKDEYGHYIPCISNNNDATSRTTTTTNYLSDVAAVYDPLFELENTTIPTRRYESKASKRSRLHKLERKEQQQRCVISSSVASIASSRKRKMMRVDVDVSDDDEFWSKLLSY